MMRKESYEDLVRILKIGNRAAHKAREENRRAGLPNVNSRNGILYWELPDGTMTMQNPLDQPKPPDSLSS